MIVLPHTPPIPIQLKEPGSVLPSHLLALRAALHVPQLSTSNESIRYVVNLEEYLEAIVELTSQNDANRAVFSSNIPWNDLSKTGFKQFFNTVTKKVVLAKWTLANELRMTLISIGLIYMRIASDLLNETINIELDIPEKKPQEYSENWKQIVNLYKKSISFFMYGDSIEPNQGSLAKGALRVNATLFSFLMKISEISIQMSILAKFLWINRLSFNYNEQVTTENNVTLAKVAIYCMNELEVVQNLLKTLIQSAGKKSEADTELLNLDYTDWEDYLKLVKRYVSAYAGFFLAIQHYREDKLGNALGLIQFSLLTLQSKQEVKPGNDSMLSRKVTLRKLRNKVAHRKHADILQSLNSISTLDLNNSAFNDKSGIVLNDLTYLYDQLIKLNLKLTSENDNLKFDNIVHWSSVGNDAKWPIGCKIPVSKIEPYKPKKEEASTAAAAAASDNDTYTGRGSYF
ncbi:hypothetical protein KGF56_004036 [Candida oxycetoniae]|uniref:Uncharacterized protein n=1 Tax=Candida oxycetoniae TaxID=497107 RepID=A0AAI9SU71_9ASCO|nr:uncharacterized protein KGF56_004036 [Candida oxycetoniae]KAI3403147.2 hypothetical protein KGF56_004036 [Candida oxycetoniae]